MGEVRRTRVLLASTAVLALVLLGALLVTPHPALADASDAALPVTCGDLPVVQGRMRCFSTVSRPTASSIRPYASTTTRTQGWTPQDITSLYGLPDIPADPDDIATGTGPLVAVVDAGGAPELESDLATYRTAYGLGDCTTADGCLTIMSQRGSTSDLPALISGWDLETTLDVEAVSAACPTCRILVVQADSAQDDDLDTAIDLAATDSSYVSMSFGGDDDGMQASDAAFEAVFADHPDVTFVASSGDSGWTTNDPGDDEVCGRHPSYTSGGATHSCTEYPSSSPYVVSAGGTQATETIDGSQTSWSQSVWNPSGSTAAATSLNHGGASSGCSGWTGMTAAQALNAQAKAACGTTRGTADISSLADGFVVSYDGDLWLAGGTSLASPLLAAMYARAGNHTSPFDVYARANDDATAFTDVTSGSTAGCSTTADTRHLCSAGTGWDGPTGLGTPDGLNSLAVLGTTVPGGDPTDDPTSDPTSDPTTTTDDPTATSDPTITSDPTDTSDPTITSDPTTTGSPSPTSAPTLRPPAHTGAIKLHGKARVRTRLKASYGSFEAGATVTVTWLVGGRPVAHGKHVRVKRAWLHRKVRYVVTASATDRAPLSLTSPTVKVRR
jgi:hypothetical protein